MQKIGRYFQGKYYSLMGFLLCLMAGSNTYAQSSSSLDGIRKGAKLDTGKLQSNVDNVANLGVTIGLAIAGAFGIFLIILAILGFRKAGKDDSGRTSMVTPWIELLCGGALIMVSTVASIVAGLWGNVLNAG